MESVIERKFLFYVSPAWRREAAHVPLLYPFWGNPLDPARVPFQHALFLRHGFDTSLYSITDDLDAADAILMPYNHRIVLQHFPELLAECAAVSGSSGKPLLIDGIGDIEYPVDIPNALVLRYGGYRFLNTGNEIFIPPYADDLLEVYFDGRLPERKKSAKPVVAFAGWAELSLLQALRTGIKELPDRLRSFVDSRYGARKKGVFFRRRAIAILKSSPLIEPNILVRRGYSGHIETADADADTLRRQFVDNFLKSDYGLDVRGDANQSARLFEMLSLGTIPVILDTERNFPFSDTVDYSSFSLRIDFHEMHRLPEKILAFHNSLSEEQYGAMRRRAREAYANHFRVDAMTRHIIESIRSHIATSVS